MEFNREEILNRVESLISEDKGQEVVDLITPLIPQLTEDDSLFVVLGDAYHSLGNYDESFKIFKKLADKFQDHYAEAMVGSYFGGGVGVKPNAVEAVAYLKKASVSDEPCTQFVVSRSMAMLYEQGLGVSRDIPESYKCYKKALSIMSDDYIQDSFETLNKKYPFTDDGEIDLKVRKRSKIASFFLWAGIICNVLMAINMASYGIVAPILASCFVLLYVLVLFWNKFSYFILLAAAISSVPISVLMPSVSSDDINSVLLSSVLLMNSTNSLFILLSLLKRIDGYAHPVYALLRIRDNGCGPVKRFMNIILKYGTGDAFKDDSPQTKTYTGLRYAGLILIVIFAAIAGWEVATTDMGMEIEWNCFNNSGLLTALSVVGFFLQFAKGMWVKSSYETFDVYKDEYGNVKKVEKNWDVLTTIEGRILFPLLCHLLIYPLVIGIMLYYIIMSGFALLQGIMPYLLGLLVLGSVVIYHKATGTFVLRKYRMLLLGVVTLLAMCIYVPMGGLSMDSFSVSDYKFEIQRPAWDKFVYATSDNVNLRKLPNVNSPKLMEQEGEMDSYLVWSDTPDYGGGRSSYRLTKNNPCPVLSETGDWYEILVQLPWANTEKAYIMKKYCKEIAPLPINDVDFYKIPSGKFEGQYVHYDCGGVYAMPSSLTLGYEADGGYIFPEAFKHEFSNNGGPEHYDFTQFTEDKIEELFGEKVKNPIRKYSIYYNFGNRWYSVFTIE